MRAGYALRYERNFGNVTFNVIQNPPNDGVIGVSADNFGGTPIPINYGKRIKTISLRATDLLTSLQATVQQAREPDMRFAMNATLETLL